MCKRNKSKESLCWLLKVFVLCFGILSCRPIIGYSATHAGTFESDSRFSIPLNVYVTNIDCNVPVHSKVHYKVHGSLTIHNVTFIAPGQDNVTAASKSGSFAFPFNQRNIGDGKSHIYLKFEDVSGKHTLPIKVVRTGHNVHAFESMVTHIPHSKNPEASLVPFLIGHELHEVYDYVDYSEVVLPSGKTIFSKRSYVKTILPQGYKKEGVKGFVSVVEKHWLSHNNGNLTVTVLEQQMTHVATVAGTAESNCYNNQGFQKSNGLTGYAKNTVYQLLIGQSSYSPFTLNRTVDNSF